MPVNAMQTKTIDSAIVKPSHGFVVVHPRYRAWLAKRGLDCAEAFLALRGEIVGGHHDRNVARVELPSRSKPRIAYLKREHRVGWRIRRRNQRAGFGFVSRSVREAKVLEHLDSQALPSPQWIAYGEDGRGRAFLLIDDLAGSLDLRIAAKSVTDSASRRAIAERIGNTLADLHAARMATPDLAAKHLFVDPDSGSMTLIDWPSATIGKPISFESRLQALAQLDASLANDLATPRERLRMLRSYLQSANDLPPLCQWLPRIARLSQTLKQRPSIRDQRCDPGIAGKQLLVWLADAEAVCVTPGLAKLWPAPAACWPYYPAAHEAVRNGEPSTILAPDGQVAILQRWRSFAPLGRLMAAVRSKCWRSPATKVARQIFRDERAGNPAATLLAFGQRTTGPFKAESFVLTRTGAEAC